MWLALAAAAAIGLGFGLAYSRSSSAGHLAPPLPQERLSGPPAAAGPQLVVFWASWCGPCAQEAPTVRRFSQSAQGRGHVVGVNSSDTLSGARAFIRRYRWAFTNLRDADGSVGSEFGVVNLPTTFVVDANGRIRGELHGPQNERQLSRALAQAS